MAYLFFFFFFIQQLKYNIQLFHVCFSIVKTIIRGAVDDLMHYCTRQKAECNSASGRPQYRGVMV